MIKKLFILMLFLALLAPFISCSGKADDPDAKKSIVVTYSILGSVVKELVGDLATVTVLIPNGLDPHEWEPSAKDIEKVYKADLIVCNGLHLEAGLEKTLDEAVKKGVRIFTASDHVVIRYIDEHEAETEEDADGHEHSAADPHLWTDPMTIKEVSLALSRQISSLFNWDLSSQTIALVNRLESLNRTIADRLSIIPETDRKLVTGHESLGYFASRYHFKLVGVIVPSLSSRADVTAANMAALKKAVLENNVKVIFTELGTSAATAKTIGKETGVKVVELNTHALSKDGSYFSFMNNMVETILSALK